MASAFAHPFVALALAPYFRRFGVTPALAVLGAACTIVPDADVIGLRNGIPYASLFGHRGFSHSLFFAALLAALLTALVQRTRLRADAVATFMFLFMCTASHGVLDALTNGGLGVAFFSPFSNHRYFFPWHPIAVSPLSVHRFFSRDALTVLSSEFRWVMMPSLLVFAIGKVSWARMRPGPASGEPER